jgi:hypothetical protein
MTACDDVLADDDALDGDVFACAALGTLMVDARRGLGE